MKNKQSNVQPGNPPASPGQVTFRLDPDIKERFEKIVTVSRRTKTSILEECLERALPALEKQFSQLA